MGRSLKYSIIVVTIILLGIQFIQPERGQQTVDPSKDLFASLPAPPALQSSVNRACYDCHSNATVWPWYSAVSPVSWLVAHDVNEGRQRLNFSLWSDYSVMKRAAKLESIADEVSEQAMPLKSYLFLHPQAKLSQAEQDSLVAWTRQRSEELMAEPAGTDSTLKKEGL